MITLTQNNVPNSTNELFPRFEIRQRETPATSSDESSFDTIVKVGAIEALGPIVLSMSKVNLVTQVLRYTGNSDGDLKILVLRKSRDVSPVVLDKNSILLGTAVVCIPAGGSPAAYACSYEWRPVHVDVIKHAIIGAIAFLAYPDRSRNLPSLLYFPSDAGVESQNVLIHAGETNDGANKSERVFMIIDVWSHEAATSIKMVQAEAGLCDYETADEVSILLLS